MAERSAAIHRVIQRKTTQFTMRMDPEVNVAGEKAAAEDRRSLSSLLEILFIEYCKDKGYSRRPADFLGRGNRERRLIHSTDRRTNSSTFSSIPGPLLQSTTPRQKQPQISPIFKADTVRLHVSREKDKEIALGRCRMRRCEGRSA
jgi:hypothetical protein